MREQRFVERLRERARDARLVVEACKLHNVGASGYDIQLDEDSAAHIEAQVAEIERLKRACRAAQANPYDEAEYLDAMEAAMGPPPEPGKWYGPGSPAVAEIERLQQHVHDCQAGMYINCVYCGHRYGPDDEVPATMANALKEHVEQCPKHPMSALKAELTRLREVVSNAIQCFGDEEGESAEAEKLEDADDKQS